MKKTIIALSTFLPASSAFAPTTHATDNDVANAQPGANTAKRESL